MFKNNFNGSWITNFSMTHDAGNEAIQKDEADFASFGKLYIANDDLVNKFITDAPLNMVEYAEREKLISYFYGDNALGYTDLSVY